MVNIFNYTDYRAYLKDWFTYKKSVNPQYSYQFLATKAGFNNRGFVYNIINKQKNLSRTNALKLSQALKHNKYETEYFENLIAFNQAQEHSEQQYYFEKLSQLKIPGKGTSQAYKVSQKQYAYYSTWYHSAIRSIIGLHGFDGDYSWLSKMVLPSISISEAKHSVKLLLTIGMIEKKKNGSFVITHDNITSGDDTTGLALHNFHLDCTDLSKNAILHLAREDRNITGLTLGISKDSYRLICTKTQQFQDNIIEIANNDHKADRTYQFNFHLFPLSNTVCFKSIKS